MFESTKHKEHRRKDINGTFVWCRPFVLRYFVYPYSLFFGPNSEVVPGTCASTGALQRHAPAPPPGTRGVALTCHTCFPARDFLQTGHGILRLSSFKRNTYITCLTNFRRFGHGKTHFCDWVLRGVIKIHSYDFSQPRYHAVTPATTTVLKRILMTYRSSFLMTHSSKVTVII